MMNPANLVPQDETYMRRCLELGRTAAREGESPVGAIVLRDGQVIAEAGEETRKELDVTGHAEVIALRRAARFADSLDLSGCTLYTNIEPCVLCSYAIRNVGIGRVVIGLPTSALGGVSSNYPILLDPDIPSFPAPPVVRQGVLMSECNGLSKSSSGKSRPARLADP